MINEYVTLGRKSLCHPVTGWLDVFELVSLKVGTGVGRVWASGLLTARFLLRLPSVVSGASRSPSVEGEGVIAGQRGALSQCRP